MLRKRGAIIPSATDASALVRSDVGRRGRKKVSRLRHLHCTVPHNGFTVHAVLRPSFLQWRWRKRPASPGSRPRRRRALLAATLAMENPNLYNNQYNSYSKKNKEIG